MQERRIRNIIIIVIRCKDIQRQGQETSKEAKEVIGIKMEALEQKVNEEVDIFKKNCLKCSRERDCLPLYIFREISLASSYIKDKLKKRVSRGFSVYNLKSPDERKKFVDIVYIMINEMRDLLYPNEPNVNIKPECNNDDCAIYSILRYINVNGGDKKRGNGDFVPQKAAEAVFKYKESEAEHQDIGDTNAWIRWCQRPIIYQGRDTTLSKEFRRIFDNMNNKTRNFY